VRNTLLVVSSPWRRLKRPSAKPVHFFGVLDDSLDEAVELLLGRPEGERTRGTGDT